MIRNYMRRLLDIWNLWALETCPNEQSKRKWLLSISNARFLYWISPPPWISFGPMLSCWTDVTSCFPWAPRAHCTCGHYPWATAKRLCDFNMQTKLCRNVLRNIGRGKLVQCKRVVLISDTHWLQLLRNPLVSYLWLHLIVLWLPSKE